MTPVTSKKNKSSASKLSEMSELLRNKDAYSVLRKPRISEKASLAQAQNKYVFDVFPGATKNDVRRVVELMYKVKVSSVAIIKLPPKIKKFTRTRIVRGNLKKAVVTLRSGEKIDIIAQ